MVIRRFLFAVTVLAVVAPTVAVWLAPHHPRSITARRNTGRWE